ncbi:MAG: YCF48-related protein, partial [candidate division WOR-3 bacterium]|nr:YCF48-related protein [candidate division WOR-3 bacterium]
MNYKHYLLMLTFIVKIGESQAFNHPWSWLNPLPSDNGFSECYAIDSNTVFIIDYDYALIYKTTDGGLTWNTKWVPYPDSISSYYRFYGIDFPTPNVGYIAGVSSRAIILKTTDQGETWNYKYMGPQQGLFDIDFPQGNSVVGYAVGTQSFILKTTDGGETWNQQSNPGANYQVLRAVHFPVNADTGYAVGGLNTYDTLHPLILKTTNGGQNWIVQTSPVPGGYHGVYFCNNNVGYACGSVEGYYGMNPKGVIIKTTNGGNNWQLIYYTPGEYVKGIYFLTPTLGYVFIVKGGGGTYSSLIRKTTNGGATWDSIIPPQRCAVHYKFSFSFANQQIGYGVGTEYDINFGRGRIFKTTNGGTTWFSLKKGPDVSFWAVDFPENDQVGYVVGDSGYILKTTNGGLNWIQQFTGTGQAFRDVDFINNQIGFAVGNNGTFFKTTNGGNTWVPKNSNTTATLYAVKFVNSQIGYIGGLGSAGGVIMKTTDGGDNWMSQTIPNNNTERAIQDLLFFNVDTGYAVAGATPSYGGAVGIVYKTTNGGQTWVENYAPSSANFYVIDFPVNSQVGYV